MENSNAENELGASTGHDDAVTLPLAKGNTHDTHKLQQECSAASENNVTFLQIKPPVTKESTQLTDMELAEEGKLDVGHTNKKKSSIPGTADVANNGTKSSLKTKLDLSGISIEDVIAEGEVRMKRLLNTEEHRSQDVYEDLEYVKAMTRYGKYRCSERLQAVEKLTELGAVDLFKKIYSTYFGAPKIHRVLRDILVVLWNGTDSSINMCQVVISKDVHKQIFECLNSDVLSPDETEVSKNYIIKGLLGILNNVSRLVDGAGQAFCESGAVDVLKRYLTSNKMMIRCKCELILAYIMTEKEYEEMNADDSSIKFFIKLLESAMSSPEHHSKTHGFSADEVLQGLNKIAVSDCNKVKMVQFGILKYYVILMQPDCTRIENYEATRGIWILAFKCAEDIKNVPGCLESLKVMASHTDDHIRKQALGALWILEEKDQQVIKAQLSDIEEQKDEIPHVFISYQWNNQKTMLRVRNHLRDNDYKVWMDVDGMTGSILESMAVAVEKACVVIICMSQKYKESPNCRTEAEYTFRLRKEIIPLRLQMKYQADGWLGALVGNKLFFDFSKEDKFEETINRLIKELANRGRRPNAIIKASVCDVTQAPTVTSPDNTIPAPVETSNIMTWSPTDVTQWIMDRKLELPLEWFRDVEGSLLVELKELQCAAPEFFYDTLRKELHLSLKQILRFSTALKNI